MKEAEQERLHLEAEAQNQQEDADEFSDMDSNDSVDLSEEEEKGLTDIQIKIMKERAAVRIMRSQTRSLAKSGNAIDRQIT